MLMVPPNYKADQFVRHFYLGMYWAYKVKKMNTLKNRWLVTKLSSKAELSRGKRGALWGTWTKTRVTLDFFKGERKFKLISSLQN